MKTVIEMAREAGLPGYPDDLERFAALVRADEREACEKAMHAVSLSEHISKIAEAIKARWNT
jgi:hypothetical protein